MSYAKVLEKADGDFECKDYVVVQSSGPKKGEDGVTYYEVSLEDSLATIVRDELLADRGSSQRSDGFKKGDVLRFWGRGFGYVVRGIALVLDGDLHVYRYMTSDEEKADHARQVAKAKTDRAREWEEKRAEILRKVSALPEPFRRRFEFFMRRPSWGAEFGLYEVFCMGEAHKIARICKTPERVAEFLRGSPALQKGAADSAGIALAWDDHSGNTFGCACQLAHAFLSIPGRLHQVHGALCPLVGCAEYGCYASTVSR